MFPISRDPPEGGTGSLTIAAEISFEFPISRDPPEGGTSLCSVGLIISKSVFPISRDPPEGGTIRIKDLDVEVFGRKFPISRDPPEGGT